MRDMISNIGPKRPVLPIDFVRNGQPMTEFVKVDPNAKGDPMQTRDGYVPTARVVGCVRCQKVRGRATLGTLDFPQGFSEKTGDRIMDAKAVKAYCPVCRNVEEMRPLTPTELREAGMGIVARYQEIYEKQVVKKEGAIVSPAEAIEHVTQHMMNPGGEESPDGESKIITPD